MTSPQRRPLIAGNWKMYKTPAQASRFAEVLAEKLLSLPPTVRSGEKFPEVLLCPPFIALDAALKAVSGLSGLIDVAAQTMESRDEGAYTGEISPAMLLDLGVRRVIIGHSERRQYYNETDATVNAKVLAALNHNMTPIACVGETLEQRQAGQTDTLITRQVEAAIQGVTAERFGEIVFAYEPVWAIGTGQTCEADEANRVCGLIREILGRHGDASSVRVLYGGSVKPENSLELMARPEIDGALVGGASLEPEAFFQIIRAAVREECAV